MRNVAFAMITNNIWLVTVSRLWVVVSGSSTRSGKYWKSNNEKRHQLSPAVIYRCCDEKPPPDPPDGGCCGRLTEAGDPGLDGAEPGRDGCGGESGRAGDPWPALAASGTAAERRNWKSNALRYMIIFTRCISRLKLCQSFQIFNWKGHWSRDWVALSLEAVLISCIRDL